MQKLSGRRSIDIGWKGLGSDRDGTVVEVWVMWIVEVMGLGVMCDG